jgi:GAF domain-containing protein
MDDMVPHGIGDVAPWRDWPSAVDGALEFLAEHVGWDVWVVTRVQGDRQVVLWAYPSAAAPPGTELPWEDSFCRQMLSGNAPRLATVTAAVPAYASRSTGPLDGVAAYVGVPLVTEDVKVFGTLCGIAFRAKPRSAARELPLVEMVARMLSTLLVSFQSRPPGPESFPPPVSRHPGMRRIAS